MSEPHMPDADEEGFFEIYWALRKENSWKRSLLPSEVGKPCPEGWGEGFKPHAREGWMARASLHVQWRPSSQGEKS